MTAVRRPPPGSTIAAMKTVALASLTADDLASLTQLVSEGVTNDPWEAFLGATLSDEDRRGLAFVLKHLRPFSVALNESTLWGRAIFPLLMLAETERIAAWSQVPVTGAAPAGEVAVTGVIDGVLAPEGALGGAPGLPYLLTVEAKRGTDGGDPRPQLLGALLATAWAQLARTGAAPDALFGCYTIGTLWTFVQVRVTRVDDAPGWRMQMRWSREFTEALEGEKILGVLHGVVRLQERSADETRA